MRALVLARFTFREALRKRVLLGVLSLSVIFLALYAAGVYYAGQEMHRAVGRGVPSAMLQYQLSQMLLAGLWVSTFLSGLLVVFTSVGTLAAEIESGTFHAIVSKPISRWEIVVGKWLGHGAMVLGYVLLMTIAIVVIVSSETGFTPGNIHLVLATLSLEMLLLLSLAVLTSSLMSTITAGIAVFMMYGIGMVGGMIKWIGTVAQNETMVTIGTISSYVMPSDALWKHAASLMEVSSPIPLGMSPFSGVPGPAGVLIVYAVLYSAAMLAGAVLAFQRKDL